MNPEAPSVFLTTSLEDQNKKENFLTVDAQVSTETKNARETRLTPKPTVLRGTKKQHALFVRKNSALSACWEVTPVKGGFPEERRKVTLN